jgi:hypothetical protein
VWNPPSFSQDWKLDCRVTATNLTNTGQVAGIPGNTTRRK